MKSKKNFMKSQQKKQIIIGVKNCKKTKFKKIKKSKNYV
jgi:hypothetical protein